MTTINGVGVVVGRFQTPVLHYGHICVLDKAAAHDNMLVFLGVHGSPGSHGQELDFAARKFMIQEAYPQAVILPLKDCPSDEVWSKNLDGKIYEIFPFCDVTFYHGRDSFAAHYHGRHKLVDIGCEGEANATVLRERCYSQPGTTSDFRHGVFYGLSNRYPTVSPTVDIAITRNNRTEVLLGKKADGRGWRFPGGFIDLTDMNAEMAAVREAHEETGLYVQNPDYISSRNVNDWRNTPNSTVMTFFYHFEYQMGPAKAADDLAEIAWHNIEEFDTVTLVPEHKHLFGDFMAFLEKGVK